MRAAETRVELDRLAKAESGFSLITCAAFQSPLAKYCFAELRGSLPQPESPAHIQQTAIQQRIENREELRRTSLGE